MSTSSPPPAAFLVASHTIQVLTLHSAGRLTGNRCSFRRRETAPRPDLCGCLRSHQTEASRRRSHCPWAVKHPTHRMDLVSHTFRYLESRSPASLSIRHGRDIAVDWLPQSGSLLFQIPTSRNCREKIQTISTPCDHKRVRRQ